MMIYKLLRSSTHFALVVALGISVGVYAQSNTHYGSQTVIANIANNGLNAPQGIAVDSSGNLYITDTGNGRVLKETLSGGSYTQSVVATITPSSLDDVAVDSSGNLYVIDGFYGKVYKETLSGNSYVQSTITVTGLSVPGGIAVDSSGNVYITDYDNKRVLKETPSGSSYNQTVVTTSGLSFPVGVAVDSSGNVYIADSGNSRVLKETLSGSSYTQSVVVDDSSIQWLGSIEQLAVDSSGSVYIGGGSIVKATFSGGTYHIGNLGDSIAQPYGVAVDSSGNVYATSTSGGGGEVVELSYPATSFGAVAVGSTSAVLTFPFTKGTDINTASAGAALSMDAAGEFVDTGTGTCDTNGVHTYTAGTGCTVNVTFTPKFAGIRNGVVEFVNSSNVVVAEEFITGTGTAPQVEFAPGTQSTIGTSLSAPTGVAVDGKGNIYVADGGSNNEFFVETPSGSTYTQALVGFNQSGLKNVSGIAVDGAGDLYFGYSQSGLGYTVAQEQPIIGLGYNVNLVANTGLASGLSSVTAVAVDGGGNVYIADTGNNRVIEELYFSGITYNQPVGWQIVVAGTGLSSPAGVAVDSSGNVYIADTGNNRVLRETPSAGGLFTQSVVVNTGLSGPTGLGVDDIGNLYISDTGNQRVLKEAVSGSSYTQSVVLSSGLGSPQGLALDAGGNIYIADATNKVVVKLNLATAPSLTFASTAVGSTSSDSPQTVTLENQGTAALVFPIPGTGNNPSISANFSLNSTGGTACPLLSSSASTTGTLAANASCTLPISFAPTAVGIFSGSLVLTGNNLNVAASTEKISLGGTGTIAPVTLSASSLNFGSVTVNTTSTAQSVTVTNNQAAALHFSSITVAAPYAIASTGTTCAVGTPVAAAGSCTLALTFTPTLLGATPGSLTIGDDAPNSPQTVSLSGSGTGIAPVTLSASSLNFGSVTVNTTSPTQTVTLTNNQTSSVTIASLAVTAGSPYSISALSTCLNPTLAAGASCTVVLTFSPVTLGAASAAALTITAAGSPQTVSLSGTGIAPVTLSASSLNFGSVTVNTTSTAQSVTVTNNQASSVTIASLAVTAGSPYSISASSTCLNPTLAAGASCTVVLTFSPVTLGAASAAALTITAASSPQTVSLSGTGVQAAQAITFTQPTTPVTYSSGLTIPLSATGGASGNAVVFTIDASSTGTGSITGSTLTVTGVGSFVIDANQAGNTNYSAAPQVQRTVAVTQATQTITFTAPTSPVTYGVSPITLVATGGGSGNPIAFSIVSGASYGSLSGTNNNTLTITGVGTIMVAANQAGNTNYSAATQVTQSIVVNVIGAAGTPTFSPVSGTYTAAQTVSINDATSGATIYYTTDGTTPTTSSTKYTTTIPIASTETLQAIATATGYSTSAVATAAYTIANPQPAISGLSPAFTDAGGAVLPLTVNGSGFIASSTAYWGASALTTTYVSATQLTAQVPASDIATAGTIAITVQSPAPGGGTSNAWQFEVDTASSGTTGPTITSTTETVAAGSTASYPVTVPSSVTSISVTCLNLPAGATCSYSSATNMVTITTSPTTPKGTYQIIVVFTETVTSAAFLLPILLLPIAFIRRRSPARGIWITACLGLVLLATAALSIGCGGGPSPPPSTQQMTSSGSVSLTIQ